ncbi:MAG TPA: hypothetical protein VFO10_10065 [Oligoflexus sp.]|uniref:hypothetical protein n=1 Tax=Oligoflexus sp. TaxID=1971216 RepID=UPI002D7E9B84|nr:hypothetical protein [Oligoflexus sp.]HET9237586.1 hypothetical protein [Oligoflexus sp.]
MKRLFILCAWISLLGSGCTYTVAVSQSNIPAQRKKPVTASVSKFIFLGLNFDNDFALQLGTRLKEACPQGSVRGVTTQDMLTIYLPGIFWARETSAQGYCMPQKATASLEPEWGDLAAAQE